MWEKTLEATTRDQEGLPLSTLALETSPTKPCFSHHVTLVGCGVSQVFPSVPSCTCALQVPAVPPQHTGSLRDWQLRDIAFSHHANVARHVGFWF